MAEEFFYMPNTDPSATRVSDLKPLPMRSAGAKKGVHVEFTRPADATPYAALDVVGVNLAVTGATNASPIVVTTAAHGLADGDPVSIAGVGGNTNSNGDYFAKVTGFSAATFALYSDKALTLPVAGNAAYTAGGTVARLFRLPNVARAAAQGGYVVKVQVTTDLKTCVARFKLHVFNAPVPAVLDNVLYPKLWANRLYRSGEIVMPAMATEDPASSTGASAIATTNTLNSNLPLPFLTQGTDADLYFMLQTLDAFTPANGQNVRVSFLCEDD
jgi:hypothetical protein